MNTYLLFINGLFETPEELDNFSKEFIETYEKLSSPKFIIENKFNIIIVFDTELDEEEISIIFKETLSEKYVRFYFLFNRESLLIANVPQEISDVIFKELPKNSSLEIKLLHDKIGEPTPLDYDDKNYVDALLEKIDKFGIKSLTEAEKKYLDNFNN